MIPRTFPSSVASNGSTQMIVYFLPSVSGLTRWVDYIPVKFTTVATAATENTYNQNGYIPVVSLSSIAGATPFKEYVPVFLDSSAVDADVWDVTITGFIPVGTAGIGGAALYLDFAATTSLDRRITFSRTTNATLTNSAGLVANAPTNLLTFSEQFDNAAWGKSSATIVANSTTAPDGTTTADKIVPNAAATGSMFRGTVSSAQTITFSLYAKAAEWRYLRFQLGASFNPQPSAWFDLQTGVVVSQSGTSASIQSVGDGWYRLIVVSTWVNATDNAAYFNPSNNSSSYTTGDGTSGIYLWGAQLELGSTATTYNPTTVKNLLGYTEHFDNAAWTKSNAFVQTNLLLQSEAFDTSNWTKLTTTVTANTVASPDGALTADTILYASGGSPSQLFQSVPVTTGPVTVSVYLRADAPTSMQFGFFDSAVDQIAINVTTSWQRFTYTRASGLTSGDRRALWLWPTNTGSNISVYAWGAQLVQGTSAGDYKATYAAAAAVGYTDIYGQPFAQKLVENATASAKSLSQGITGVLGTVYTYSVYAKRAERKYLRIIGGSVSFNLSVNFDLDDGSYTITGGGGDVSAVSVGNGWYKCSITRSATGTSINPFLSMALTSTGAGDYTGDGTSGIYIFGAQLSDSASVDPYVYNPVAAPSSTAYYGPRFDYDPVTLAPKGLLIEEQRTNLLTYSEQFDNAAWTKVSATITANSDVSPTGNVDADLITVTGASGRAVASYTFTAAAHTFSVFLKYSSQTNTLLRIVDGTNTFTLTLSWNGGVPAFVSNTGSGYAIAPVGNGWYRASITATTLAAAGTVQLYANGFGSSGAALVWGAQLEAGALATSYIPTVASQVTRAADSASMIGNNFARWYNQTTGTIFTEFDYAGYSSFNGIFGTGADATHNIQLSLNSSSVARLVVEDGTTQVNQTATSGAAPINQKLKLAAVYAVNDFAVVQGGGTVNTDTSGTVPISSLAAIGNAVGFTRYLNGHISRIAYYPRRLANTELQGITA